MAKDISDCSIEGYKLVHCLILLFFSGPNQTQHVCLLDSMRIELVDMDLFTATRIAVNNQQSSSEFSYKSQVWQNVLI